ncbi:MAG TPA: hypothetical protein VF297_25470 [Pyrinomonadaceae bacterium]
MKDKLEHESDEKSAAKPMQEEPVAGLMMNEENPAVVMQRILGGSPSVSAADISTLQRMVGNQAVLRLLSMKSQEQPPANAGAAFVMNNSRTTIYVKPEEGGGALPVGPGGLWREPIDGVATHKYKDRVYKVVSGTRVTIDEDGDVDPDLSIPIVLSARPVTVGQMPVGDLANFVAGGWKDQKWLEERHEEKDTGWDALFAKAAIIEPPREEMNELWYKTLKGIYDFNNWSPQ